VFEPSDEAKPSRLPKAKGIPTSTPGRAVLVGLMQRYLASLMDPFVSLLEVHELMYFAQEAGEPLRLEYVKGPYGPYAENLRHVLAAVEGYLVSGYGDGGDAPDKRRELVPGANDDAQRSLQKHPTTLARFARVAQLVDGFESAFGTELLATVHWVATREHPKDEEALVRAVHDWGPRKRAFTPRQINLTAQRLKDGEWLVNARA
jgi:hypothetical protein